LTPSAPPRVDYELTALGRSMLVPVRALGQWAQARIPGGVNSPVRAFRGVGGTTTVNAAINVIQISALVVFSVMAIS